MKKDTMKRLMALPKEVQDKVWQLAQDRLKQGKMPARETPPPQGKTKK